MTALDSHCPPAPPFDFFLLHHNSTVCLLLQATACAVRSQLRSMPQGSLAVTPKTNDSIITVIRSPCVKTTCIIFVYFLWLKNIDKKSSLHHISSHCDCCCVASYLEDKSWRNWQISRISCIHFFRSGVSLSKPSITAENCFETNSDHLLGVAVAYLKEGAWWGKKYAPAIPSSTL